LELFRRANKRKKGKTSRKTGTTPEHWTTKNGETKSGPNQGIRTRPVAPNTQEVTLCLEFKLDLPVGLWGVVTNFLLPKPHWADSGLRTLKLQKGKSSDHIQFLK